MAGLGRYLEDQAANPWRSPKYPASWLRAGCYDDEPTTTTTTRPNGHGRATGFESAMATAKAYADAHAGDDE
jgi:hypothetical protein